nr:hypothetical protein ISGA_225 [Gordonia sp. NB41Y]
MCEKCGRPFALEPKETMHGLHDVRVRKLSAKLRTADDLAFTYTQFIYATARNRLSSLNGEWTSSVVGWAAGIVVFCYFLVLVSLPITMLGSLSTLWTILALIGCGVALIVVSVIAHLVRKPVMLQKIRISLDVAPADLAEGVETRWRSVYGEPIPGAVNDDVAPLPYTDHPRVAVVCPSRSVLVCLAANGFADRYAVALVHHPDDAPPGVPVLVLHDASPAGVALMAYARARLGPRARDVGLLRGW